jgi:hypothetical protein
MDLVRTELWRYGLHVGNAMYEKCLFGSGVYPLGETTVVKAELADDSSVDRLEAEATSMIRMCIHSICPMVYSTGSFPVPSGKTIVYIVMERYACDLGEIGTFRPSLVLDQTVGWMIHRRLRQVAYRAGMMLTDMKPTNIVVNIDRHRSRISDVVLIDFGPEYCVSLLSLDVHPHTAYIAMLLLYVSISIALRFHQCANLMLPFIKRQSPDAVQAVVTWMDGQPIILKSIRQYTLVKTASELYSRYALI